MAETVIKDKAELLSKITKTPSALKKADPKLLKSKKFIKEAVAVNPKAIKYADGEILKDYDFLQKLVSVDGMIAAYIPAEYSSTYLFLLAIENTLEVEQFIPKRVYKDMADGIGIRTEKPYIICHSLSHNYEYYGDRLAKSKNLAIFISKHFRLGFHQCLAKKYSTDKDVAMVAVRTFAHNFYYIDKSLQSDMDIIKCAYRNDPTAFVRDMITVKQGNLLKPFRGMLVNDRDFIKDCLLSGDVCVIEPEYADDEEIALLAMKNALDNTVGEWHDAHKKNYSVLSDQLKLDDRIIRMELESNGQSLYYMPDVVKDNEQYVRLALKNTVYASNYISKRLMGDESFVLEMLNQYESHDYFYFLNNVDSKLLSHNDILELTSTMDLSGLDKVCFEGTEDDWFEFIVQLVELVTQNPSHPNYQDVIKYLPEICKDDAWIATLCVVNNPAMYQYAGDEIKDNPDFVLSIMTHWDVDISEYLTAKVRSNDEVAAYLRKKTLKEKLGL